MDDVLMYLEKKKKEKGKYQQIEGSRFKALS
jgi:hypothetical protein